MRRKAKAKAAAPAAPVPEAASAEPNGSGPGDEDPTMVEQPAEQTAPTEPVAAAPPSPPPPPTPSSGGGLGPDYSTTGDGGDPRDFSVNHYLDLGDLFTTPRNMSEDERERMAAADFQAAIAPALAAAPEPVTAATPDEAVRQFVEKTGPALPDPGAGIEGNIFNREATAYMRIRRQFNKGIGRAGGPWTAPPGLMPGAPPEGGQHRVFYPSGS